MIRLAIPGEDDSLEYSLPDALAAARRYFLAGGTGALSIEYDGLLLGIALKPGWPLERLP